MVDADGGSKYSPVKIVKIDNNNLSISVYPNPVASQLRITIPEKVAG